MTKYEILENRPLTASHVEQAEKANVTLLYRTNNRLVGYYELPCKHKVFLYFNSVRKSKSKFVCEECTIERLKTEAEQSSMTFISKFNGDDTIPRSRWCDYAVYKHNDCGHEEVLLRGNVARRKTKYCKTCADEMHKDVAKNLGMTFVKFSRPAKGGTLYIDVTLPCGHYKSIQTGNLQAGNWKCQECWKEDLTSFCNSIDITIIAKQDGANYLCRLPCGCTAVRHLSNIKTGGWLCHQCGDNHYTRESYIYLIKYKTDNMSWLKLGYSGNLENRFSSYGVDSDVDCDLLKLVTFTTGHQALLCEKRLHSEFKDQRLDPILMKDYHKVSGFTECYPITLQEGIIKRMEMLNERN